MVIDKNILMFFISVAITSRFLDGIPFFEQLYARNIRAEFRLPWPVGYTGDVV